MSVTFDDYIRSVKEEIIIARQNDIRGFLVKSSPAQLRNLCLLLFDEGLNNNDKVIFESFFSATNDDDLRKKIENVDIDKFRPIRNLIEGAIYNPTPTNLELTAILISYKHRPYRNFYNRLVPVKKFELIKEESLFEMDDKLPIPVKPKKKEFKTGNLWWFWIGSNICFWNYKLYLQF